MTVDVLLHLTSFARFLLGRYCARDSLNAVDQIIYGTVSHPDNDQTCQHIQAGTTIQMKFMKK